MHILAQLIGPHGGILGVRIFGCALLGGLIILIPGCTPAPTPAPVSVPAPPALLQETTAVSPSSMDFIPDHPLAAWSYAEDFEDFHAIWTTRFSLSVTPYPDSGALLPYADAVMNDGVSWGIAPEDIQLVFFDRDRRLCRVTGPTHPATDDARDRSYLSPSEIVALDWESLQGTETVREEFSMTRVQVVGALRADATCLACHSVESGSLLAVLVYGFSEIPDD